MANDTKMLDGRTEGHPDVILIYSNTYNFRRDDDPSFPFRMEYNLQPPDFMRVAFAMMYGGSDEGTFKGRSVEALIAYAEESKLTTNGSLRWIRIADEKHRIVKSLVDRHQGWVDEPPAIKLPNGA